MRSNMSTGRHEMENKSKYKQLSLTKICESL